MYNGYDATEHVTSQAVTRNAITNMGAIVGRGVLLDMARHHGVEHLEIGHVITPDDLDACARAQDVALARGDICLVRTGWYRIFESDRALFDEGEPGLSYRCADWFHRLELVALGSDNCAVDVLPGEPGVRPYGLHPRIINQQGGYLIEYLDLEELARRESSRVSLRRRSAADRRRRGWPDQSRRDSVSGPEIDIAFKLWTADAVAIVSGNAARVPGGA